MNLPFLEFLNLIFNRINNIKPLSEINSRKLKYLFIQYNQIVDIHVFLINDFPILERLRLDNNKIVYISAKENKGIDELKNKIINMFNINQLETKDLTYLSSARSIALLKQAIQSLNDIKKGIDDNLRIDMI